MSVFVAELKIGMEPNPDENIFHSIWKEYERVILQSIVTSFGLDFLLYESSVSPYKDQHGGDVDTLHTVSEIDKDPDMRYKNPNNEADYVNRGKYETSDYHNDSEFRSVTKDAKKDFNEKGIWINDVYVPGNKLAPVSNKTLPRNRQGQLDHVISAHRVHDDRKRILSGKDGREMANWIENLKYTNACLNRNKSDMSVAEYREWCKANPDKVNWNGNKGEAVPEEVLQNMERIEKQIRKKMDTIYERTYYTSAKFAGDAAIAAGKRGVQLGVRQALGFVFVEIWFAAKEELQAMPSQSDLADMLKVVANGISKGLDKARRKWKDLVAKIEEGFVAGALASLTTTLCNIFFTTAKNLVRNIRQIYASVVQAGKVLLFNPDNLMFGDRIKTSTIILATGASVLVGTAVGELIGATPIGKAPEIGDIVRVFSSTLVSGLLSCTLLVFLDRSKFMNQIITKLNSVATEVSNYREIADAMESLAAKIANLDIAKFRAETEKYNELALQINCVQSEEELHNLLLSAYKVFNIQIPWKGDFDTFMRNRTNQLVFE